MWPWSLYEAEGADELLCPLHSLDVTINIIPPRGLVTAVCGFGLSSREALLPTQYGRRNIRYEGVQLYNALPIDIRNASSLAIFKTRLKLHLAGSENQL